MVGRRRALAISALPVFALTACATLLDIDHLGYPPSATHADGGADPLDGAAGAGDAQSDTSSDTRPVGNRACNVPPGSTVPITPNVPAPRSIAIAGENVYWASAAGVHQCPRCGCGSSAPVQITGDDITVVAADDTTLLWANHRTNDVWRCSLPMCDHRQKIAGAAREVYALALGGGTPLYGTDEAVFRVECMTNDACVSHQVGTGKLIVSIHDRPPLLYWAGRNSGLHQCPNASCDGGDGTIIDDLKATNTGFIGSMERLAFDDERAYWTDGINKTITSCVLGDCGAKRVDLALTGGNSPFGIARHGTHVYWTEPDSGALRRVAAAAGAIDPVVGGRPTPSAMVAAEGGVYWGELTGTDTDTIGSMGSVMLFVP